MLNWIKSAFGKVTSQEARQLKTVQEMLVRGNGLMAEGNFLGAQRQYQDILAVDPRDVKARVNLGFVHIKCNHLEDARRELEAALVIDSGNADCLYMLGCVAEAQLDFHQAAARYQDAYERRSSFELACRDACRMLFQIGLISEAGDLIASGLVMNPFNADFHFYQGNLHLASNRFDLALEGYLHALSLGADYSALHGFAGGLLLNRNQLGFAVKHLERAIELDFRNTEAHHDLGVAFHRLGHISQAIEQQKLAVAQNPNLLQAYSCLLFAMSFADDFSVQEYSEYAKKYAEFARNGVDSEVLLANAEIAELSKNLRVGLVSGDFRYHAVANFLEGVLINLGEEPLHLIAFSNNPYDDAVTERLKRHVDEWHDISQLDDGSAARLVKSRGVNILIDLSGHTAHNRLPIFAWRPAPVQVTWLGYFASTGLSEVDYILVDRISAPPQWHAQFTEKLWYLPNTRLCMDPPGEISDLVVGPLPASIEGHITFGCFQSLAKISDRVLLTWSKVMAGVPKSCLRMQVRHLEQSGVREFLLERLNRAGIALDRVKLFPGGNAESYWAAHNGVDLILDTFPYPGGTTTAEALWMGVPTVSMRGNTLLSQQGTSMLCNAGLPDWVADDEVQYVELAIRYSNNPKQLADLRAQLRQLVMASPLFDCAQFARHFSSALQAMYKEE